MMIQCKRMILGSPFKWKMIIQYKRMILGNPSFWIKFFVCMYGVELQSDPCLFGLHFGRGCQLCSQDTWNASCNRKRSYAMEGGASHLFSRGSIYKVLKFCHWKVASRIPSSHYHIFSPKDFKSLVFADWWCWTK